MKLHDRIYGNFTVDSPVLLALISSQPLQRLKKIAQYGVPDRYYHLKNYTRFEHSVGVMFLLRILGASEEEQIAGLLHDVSHTAFSHVMDWVIGDGKTENYQDEQHDFYITHSEIPSILRKFGYDAKRITDYHHFTLLEQDLPNLCADRIDYSLREFTPEIAHRCLMGLTTYNGKILCTSKAIAYLFAKNFLERQEMHWGGFEAASRYRLFADALRLALENKDIAEDDFWKTDKEVIQKVQKSKDIRIQKILSMLENRSLDDFPKDNKRVYKKFRYVDPLFLDTGKVLRLSTVDKDFKQLLSKAHTKNKDGVVIALHQ